MTRMTLEMTTETQPFHAPPVTAPRASSRQGKRPSSSVPDLSRSSAETPVFTELRHGKLCDRFCASMALSALFAFSAAALLAHASAIESRAVFYVAIACIFSAGLVQLVERHRTLSLLTKRAKEAGLSEDAAKREAKAIVKSWLS